jgi:glycerophosphoryl diester phosphodiesterase
VLGHRGARSSAPENTISAFRLAMEQGADGVEFDVLLSSDGVPVVIHDETVERTTDGHGRVRDLSAQELAGLNAAHQAPGFAKEGVPTLVQTLESLPDGAIANVELKESGRYSKQEFVLRVLPLLQSQATRLQIIVSSFDGELLALLRRASPGLPIALLFSTRDAYWLSALYHWRQIKPNALHLPLALISTRVIRALRRQNMHVAVWTVNDPDQAKECMVLGVDGIMTDHVAKICAALG